MTEHIILDEEIPEGTSRIVDLEGKEIGIFKIHGRHYALRNLCPHQGGPVCKGKITGTLVADSETGWKPKWVHDGEIVRCPWHGLEYEIPTGQCVALKRYRLKSYTIRVDQGKLKIEL